MRKIVLSLLLGLSLIGFWGCATADAQSKPKKPVGLDAHYLVSLDDVKRPPSAQSNYGAQQIGKFSEGEKDKYYFEDGMIRIVCKGEAFMFPDFSIENKTNDSIRIIWDEASFIDWNGKGTQVVHSGIEAEQRNQPQAPTVIPIGTKIDEYAYPKNRFEYDSQEDLEFLGATGHWRMNSIFLDEEKLAGSHYSSEEAYIKEMGEQFINKTYKVLLPLQINGVTYDYLFIFKINDVISSRIRQGGYDYGVKASELLNTNY